VDQQVRADIGGIDEVLARRQLLIYEGLLDGDRTLRLMDAGRGRVDVREKVGGRGLACFADMYHVAGPGRVPFVTVARVGIVRRFNTLSRWGQFTVRLESHAVLGAVPFRSRLVHGPLVVALPCPTQALQNR
jgi:hypothetical protein